MIGDVDHLIRMRVADTMTIIYGCGETILSHDQQETISHQITNALQNIITFNVTQYYV